MKIIGELEDQLLFESTGRIEYCHGGCIGLDFKGTDLTYGYDGGLADSLWTREEKLELADAMIGLWTRWKENIE